MFDFMMTEEQLKLRDEARAFTKWVPKQMILDMDAEKLHFPHEYLKEAGKRNLLGIRLPKELADGGSVGEDGIVAEEIGVASYSLACLGWGGADIVCEAVAKFGDDELKRRSWRRC
jgi:alkylation response protein AidB-like acyl-CoA dehydrogenase